MTWYEFLLFVHIAGAIVWLGGAFVFQVYGMIELRTGDAAAIARFAGNAGKIGERLFTPTSLVVVLAGIGLMLDGDWPWGRLWVVFSLAAFAGSFLVGITILAPTAKRIPVVGPATPEGQLLIRRIFGVLRIDLMFMFAIVFAMVVRPTSDDVWVVVIVAALLAAGVAIVARGLTRTPETAASTG
ncbi:MAG: DUF2269 domain-containing protein [Gaiella sp.]|nr:DUF2269 domain-containing protein [Gaiella sp.]